MNAIGDSVNSINIVHGGKKKWDGNIHIYAKYQRK